MSFKLTPKREKVITIIQWFDPLKSWDNVQSYNFQLPLFKYRDKNNQEQTKPIKERIDGINYLEAFFDINERGKAPEYTNNLRELARLLWCHRWMTTHEKMYRQGFQEGIFYPADFIDEPPYIQRFAQNACEAVARKWTL